MGVVSIEHGSVGIRMCGVDFKSNWAIARSYEEVL